MNMKNGCSRGERAAWRRGTSSVNSQGGIMGSKKLVYFGLS